MWYGMVALILLTGRPPASLSGGEPCQQPVVVQVVDRFFRPVGARWGLRVRLRSKDEPKVDVDALAEGILPDDEGFARFCVPPVSSSDYRTKYQIEVSGRHPNGDSRHPSGEPLRVKRTVDVYWGSISPQYFQVRVKLKHRGWSYQ